MLKKISQLQNAKNLTKSEQKNLNGGAKWIPIEPVCGGDGSFIYVDGKKVCCWVPRNNWYIC